MANESAGFGSLIQIVASITFPAGFSVTNFSDDADPFDLPTLQITDKTMGVNGDLITWTVAKPVIIAINVIPDSDSDRNLSILFEANRAARNKFVARDIITMSTIYPDGSSTILSTGKCTDFNPSKSLAGSGRLKTRNYMFAFENYTNAN